MEENSLSVRSVGLFYWSRTVVLHAKHIFLHYPPHMLTYLTHSNSVHTCTHTLQPSTLL